MAINMECFIFITTKLNKNDNYNNNNIQLYLCCTMNYYNKITIIESQSC